MEKNEILKIYGTDFKEMTKRLLAEGNAGELIPSKHTLIGIKPNLVSGSTADWGATTHPEVVAGIIEYLQERQFDNIIMLEGSWVGDKTMDVARMCGYTDLSEKYGVPFVDTQKDSTRKTDCAGMKLEICSRALEVEFLINVPVLKGHCQTRVTCALKNMKGIIPNREKRHFHSMGLHKPIAHLNTGIHQSLIVTDNICGDLDFEDGGNPVVRNCVMLSRDAVLTDAYACRLLHIDQDEVPYIGLAERLGVGSADLGRAKIKIIDGADACADENLPTAEKVISLRDAASEVESCSACYGCMIGALQMLKDDGLLGSLDEKVCIGQGYRGKKGLLGVGNCTSRFAVCIHGCPPTETQIYEGLRAYIEDRRR